jgi:hypothetical protein
MSSEYSWRDGWVLDFPIQAPSQSQPKYIEPVSYCKCGSWLYKQQPCTICALLEGKK